MVKEGIWDYAIHFKPNEFKKFWKEHLKQKKNILLVTGLGWDPRMIALPSQLKSLGGSGLRDLHIINYRPSSSFKSPYKKFIDKNAVELDKIIGGWANKKQIDVNTRNESKLYIGDKEISKHYIGYDFTQYTDILVDISSLPKSLYFALLYIIVKRTIDITQEVNVYVVACHDADFDSQITETVDDARLLNYFKGKVGRISTRDVPIIWAPIMATENYAGLTKLHNLFPLKDIYPILPFPCQNPRKDDDLLVEYRQAFVDEWQVESLNIIYAAEDDPLDVYRSLLNLFNQQNKALEPLGEVSMIISALSSKLSSIGAFMAAYEKKMAVGHPIGRHKPPSNMTLDNWGSTYMEEFEGRLHSVWLTGEPYV